MSDSGVQWACLDAPTKNPAERAILTRMARPACEVGTGSFLAKKTLVANTGASESTVIRSWRALEGRGLIAPGDQTLPSRLGVRADQQPRVWDLLIPYAWFPNIKRVNEERELLRLPLIVPTPREECAQCADLSLPRDYRKLAHLHRPPLELASILEAAEDRPVDIDEPHPGLSTGVSGGHPVTRDGVSHRHPVDGVSHRHPVSDGVSHRHPVAQDGVSGGHPVEPRGVTVTPELKEGEEVNKIPPPTPNATAGLPPLDVDTAALAAAPDTLDDIYDALNVREGRRERGKKAITLARLVAASLSAGWGRRALVLFVSRDALTGARSVYAVLKSRLEEAVAIPPRIDPPPPRQEPPAARRPSAPCGDCYAGKVMAGEVGGIPCPRCRPDEYASYVAKVNADYGTAAQTLDELGVVLDRRNAGARVTAA